jgi:putative SOS response-associated peptidase YedK
VVENENVGYLVSWSPRFTTGLPVILRPQDYGIWLGAKPADAEALSAACAPIPAEEMRAYPISTRVNSPRNDESGILEEVAKRADVSVH